MDEEKKTDGEVADDKTTETTDDNETPQDTVATDPGEGSADEEEEDDLPEDSDEEEVDSEEDEEEEDDEELMQEEDSTAPTDENVPAQEMDDNDSQPEEAPVKSSKKGTKQDMAEWPIHEKAAAMVKEVKFAASAGRKASGIDLRTVEVLVTFDLGCVHIGLSDLEALREGYTFTVDRPNEEFVTIRANGQPIGNGRIVSIDGRIGVQIEELHS
jgi:flagellar motor switch/type III secretory pathway protein FliN